MIGKTLAHYEIIRLLGKGGMGEVFRAHDSSLDREVAIKILPREMSDDPERTARFKREARTLASLQHANIASVYGYEDVDGVRFLVMELVDGEDLSERLSRGAIPLDDAIDIATQIAAGLEAAHDQGIVHRDLKPANIKLTPSGEVKVLDFGLARAYVGNRHGDTDESPTITAAMTGTGVILGTAAYMSPEQARGGRVDNRSDMWSFGVVLFEMLTGTRLFGAETVSDTMAAVLRGDPDFDLLPEQTPASVRRLLRRCLQRDPRLRIRSAGDAALELTETEEAAPPAPAAPFGTSRWLWALVGTLAVALAASLFMRPGDTSRSGPRRLLYLDVALPHGLPVGRTAPTLSPDGNWLAFVVQDSLDRHALYLRHLGRFDNELAGEIELLQTEADVGALFWSPDSKQLGIQTSAEILALDLATRMTQRITGGMAFARGASWAPDGTILYAPRANSGLFAVKSFGGSPRRITSIDSTLVDISHRWPTFLPDGKRFLFTMWSNAADELEEFGGIYLAALDASPPVRLLKDASQVLVDPAGYLLFHRKGNLMHVPFDFETAEIRADPTVAASDVIWNANNGSVKASVSGTGDLVLSSAQTVSKFTLGWLKRDEGFESVLEGTGRMMGLRLSPSGRYAAMDRLTPGSPVEIWIVDLNRLTLSKLSRFVSDSWAGAFSRDGTQYVYTNQDPGFERLLAHGIDGATDPVRLVDLKSVNTRAGHWTSNGQLLFSHRLRTAVIDEIWVYDFAAKESRSLLADDFSQNEPALSPNGRWLAYTSDESGRNEVYVRPYPALNRKWQASTNGGESPHWRSDGKQLLYHSRPGEVHAVQISAVNDQLEISKPFSFVSFDRRYQNVVPDASHERFLCGMVENARESLPLRFISNWRAKLELAPR